MYGRDKGTAAGEIYIVDSGSANTSLFDAKGGRSNNMFDYALNHFVEFPVFHWRMNLHIIVIEIDGRLFDTGKRNLSRFDALEKVKSKIVFDYSK